MKKIGFIILALGFCPALYRAACTDAYLQYIDYTCALAGFVIGAWVMDTAQARKE